MRFISAAALAFAFASCLSTTPAAADLADARGATVPNTSSSSTDAQLSASSGSGSGTVRRLEPFFPGSNNPGDVAALGSTGSPEDDLAAALDALAGAPDTSTASAAIDDALAILEGDASGTDAHKAYRGIPLLNWNLPAKVKDVPPGGDVDVTEVRFGDHAITDTWLLRFAAPEQPFTITWHVTELGTSFGGQVSPTPLLQDGAARIGGQHSILWPLALPNLLAGTTSHGRFHPGGEPEETRLGTQTLTVRMPPAGMVSAVLDPNLKPGHETFAQLLPATPERMAKAQDAFGFAAGSTPSDAQKATAIARLADDAPEKQVWSDLKRLDPGSGGFLDAARAVGAGDRSLVAAMRSRDELPNGVPGAPGADVDVVLMNDEAYVSRRAARLAPGASLTIAVTNRDKFTHGFGAVAMGSRERVFGAVDWGRFAWTPLDAGNAASVPPGATRQVTVTPADGAFALWLGDPDLGDQAGVSVELDRGPKIQSIPVGPAFSLPVHGASDADGNIWVSLAGTDKIARITPAEDLPSSKIETFLVPGGETRPGMPTTFGPADVVIDGRGIVWMTLPEGNGILRADPARVRDGTDEGVTVIPLKGCDETCRPPIGLVTPAPLSRVPSHLRVYDDEAGNAMVFFTEGNADAIGLIRVSAEGTRLAETRFPCECTAPEGIVLDGDGQVWFTEIFNNRIGRLRIDLTRPFDAPAVDIEHYKIPSAIEVFTPGLPICRAQNGCTGAAMNPVITSEPLSMQIDRAGRVWFTEAEAQKLAYVDPALAEDGTTKGITEFTPPVNDFHRLSSPSDIGIDREGSLYFSDEYGDIVGRVTADGPQEFWRPPARQSLPEVPFTDTRGDLWFIEVGAAQLTRISGVTAGVLPPARPPVFTFETASGTVRASGLRDIESVDVKVLRGGAQAAGSHDVAVSDGDFATKVDSLQGDDRVVIVPHGRYAPPPFSFPVADLRAALERDGSVAGFARHGGRALGDRVQVEAGAARGSAEPGDDGRFSLRLGAGPAAGTVSWAGAMPNGAFRTVTPLAARPHPGGAPGGGPGAGAGCPRTPWLSRRRAKRTVRLLGMTGAQVRRCYGAPRSTQLRRTFQRWSYAHMRLTVKRGKVSAFTLTGPALRSAPDGARVGSRLAVFRRALGKLARDRRARTYRALVRHGKTAFADVRISMARKRARVARVRVTLVRRAQLDRTGRRLAAHLNRGGSSR
ncbi:MAG TPA: hypothetical protein VGJ70_22615 [Solirubrobacteraceae bacterium]